MLKQLKTNNKFFLSSDIICKIHIFFFVFNLANARKIDSLITSVDFQKFKYHLTADQENAPVLISHHKYIELQSFKIHESELIQNNPSIKLDLSTCYSLTLGPELYLVSSDGSTVYKFNKEFGLKQLNNPKTKRSNYDCSIFSYKGSIYRIGGQGSWSFNGGLFKFDFEINKWRFITNILKNNFGFINPHTSIVGNKVHVMARWRVNNFNNKRSKTGYIYTVDLDVNSVDKYKFDYRDFNQYFKGSFYKNNYFKIKDGIGFINRQHKTKAMIFDLKAQTSSLVELKSPVDSYSKIIYHDNKLYFLDEYDDNPNQMISEHQKIHISISEIVKINKEHPFKKHGFSYEIVSLLSAFLIFYIIYIINKKSPFVLENKYIKKGNHALKLNNNERYFVKCLVKDGRVENQNLISYFDIDGKSYDLNVKRKNSMISMLSFKFYSQFNKDLFIKAPSNIDKRQGVYVLKQKLILADKKS
jgi:hypothetical protein